jgi:hypothetical protein
MPSALTRLSMQFELDCDNMPYMLGCKLGLGEGFSLSPPSERSLTPLEPLLIRDWDFGAGACDGSTQWAR